MEVSGFRGHTTCEWTKNIFYAQKFKLDADFQQGLDFRLAFHSRPKSTWGHVMHSFTRFFGGAFCRRYRWTRDKRPTHSLRLTVRQNHWSSLLSRPADGLVSCFLFPNLSPPSVSVSPRTSFQDVHQRPNGPGDRRLMMRNGVATAVPRAVDQRRRRQTLGFQVAVTLHMHSVSQSQA